MASKGHFGLVNPISQSHSPSQATREGLIWSCPKNNSSVRMSQGNFSRRLKSLRWLFLASETVSDPAGISSRTFSRRSLQRLPLTSALKGFLLRFKPAFWWTSINRYHGFSRVGLEKILSPFLEHSEEYVGVSAVFAIFCCRI